MSEVICHSILDDMVDGHDVFDTLYVGTMEEPINLYDPDTKTGCYVVLSAIHPTTGHIRIGRILVSEYVNIGDGRQNVVAKQIQFEAANLVAEYVKTMSHDLGRTPQIIRGMVAIPRSILWPSAIANFMARDENGHWHRVFSA